MRARLFLNAATAILMLSATNGTLVAAQGASGSCDRACLNGFVDQYVAALAARDPSRLPLTPAARYTENGVTLKLGDGMWGPVITPGKYRLSFADPRAGQVGAFVTLEEHGHPAILGIRLKVENRRISEMEAVIIRSTARGGFAAPQDLVDKPIFSQPLAPSERRPREELVRVANSYFEGLEQATEKLTPFDKNCSASRTV